MSSLTLEFAYVKSLGHLFKFPSVNHMSFFHILEILPKCVMALRENGYRNDSYGIIFSDKAKAIHFFVCSSFRQKWLPYCVSCPSLQSVFSHSDWKITCYSPCSFDISRILCSFPEKKILAWNLLSLDSPMSIFCLYKISPQ